MTGKVCLFNKCYGPSNWKPYGVATNEAVTYSKLLGQKRGFQQFIEFNDVQISKSGKVGSYCIVDKRYSPSKGSNIDIFIFDEEEHHSALYLEYSVHKQYVSKNCNDLITFFNFNKNSTFHLHNSLIYVKCTDRFKWTLFFGMLEFLIKNLNMSVIGSQFYFPLFSKYLIMNEIHLLHALQNCLKSLNRNCITTSNQTCVISVLKLKKDLTSEAAHSVTTLQNPKNNTSFPSELTSRKIKNLSSDACKSNQKVQLKRKSVDSYTRDDCLPKTKRFNSEKNECPCKNYIWKKFSSLKDISILNYTSILESKKWVGGTEAMDISDVDCSFQGSCTQYSNSFISNQKTYRLNQNLTSTLTTSEKSSPVQLSDNISELKNITNLSLDKLEENQPKYEHVSDLCTLKTRESASDNIKYFAPAGMNNLMLSSLEYKIEETYLKATITGENQKHIAGPSGENLAKPNFIDKPTVTFHTASGKSLKISEAAVKAAEKMFEDISSDVDIFLQNKTHNASQIKTVVTDKHCLGFQTASGKTLHASKTALEAANKMFKEIIVEETDIFPEKQTESKQNNKDCYPSFKECVDDDINNILAENFFEDIPFDEKEIEPKITDSTAALSVQKPEIAKTTQTHKIRKSLGGRRSLKPYTLKK